MSFDTLLKEVESLAESERRKLLAFMVALEDRGSSDYAEKLAGKIDDTTPGRLSGKVPAAFSIATEADGLPVIRAQGGVITPALVREIEGLAR
jgi:hypothetical protein